MKTLNIAWKALKEALRDPQLLILFLVFPGLLVVIYFSAYGGNSRNLGKFLILLVDNQDQGSLGGELIETLRAENFENEPLLTVIETHNTHEALITLNELKATALMTIPANFTSDLMSADPSRPPHLHLLRDSTSDNASFLSIMIEEPLRTFITAKTGWKRPQQISAYDFVEGTGNLNDFQFGVPGLIVFGIIFGVVYSAILLVREIVTGAMLRLRMANVNGWNLVGGITLAQLIVCVIQVTITLIVAVVCGLQSAGSYLLLGAFALVLSLSATGCGMITACFSKTDGDAANISMIFILPLVFFSGAVYPLSPMPLFTIAEKTVYFADLLPTTYATDAIRRIMIFGDPFSAVWMSFFWVVVQSLLLYVLGAWIFQCLVLRRSV